MDLRNWYKIKDEVYYQDGSWRDIYILDTTKHDWGKWIDYVNQTFPLDFYNGQTRQTEAAIDKQIVFDYWEHKTDTLNGASIKVGDITVRCHFFTAQEIENDIDPKEVETIEEHNRIIEYLKAVSKLLNKTVLLTAENQRELIYAAVEDGYVKINSD